MKLNGFGIAVVQRLCKTSVKKNLYWEIKDRIIEEHFDGFKMERRPRKIKVYGTDSTKNVRARLIEILMERVRYHKDKFIAPILHNEMKSMEVKKSGKVEHSDTTHDDQVFSYLMALYVWYEGKNLVENFHIMKSTLRTDDFKELEEYALEDALEKREKIDFESTNIDSSNEEITNTLEWVENDKNNYKTTKDVEEEEYYKNLQRRTNIFAHNKTLSETSSINFGVELETTNQIMLGNMSPGFTKIPDAIYNVDDEDEDLIFDENTGEFVKKRSVLSGNLANMYNLL